MKSIGIVRKVDELGRIVIPMELRKKFDIETNDALEIFTEDNTIVLKKYEPACIFCGETKDAFEFGGKLICPNCVKAMNGYIKS